MRIYYFFGLQREMLKLSIWLEMINLNDQLYGLPYHLSFHSDGQKNIAYDKNSECDQEKPQSQTADKPMAPQERATQQS